MQLDDRTANAVSTRPTADAAGALRWFRARDLGGGITGTTMEEDFLNDVLGTVINVLAAGGITRTKGAAGDSDFTDAIKAIIGLEKPQGALVGQLFRVSNSVYELRPSSGADVVVGIDNKILKKTGNLVWDMAADLEGAEAASTALYLYVRDNAGVLDEQISPTVPDLPGGTKPGYKSGDATRRCVGSTWNDVGQDFVPAIHGPGGSVMFTAHDADHVVDLVEAATTSWRNQTVKIPITAAGVFISAAARFPAATGAIYFAVGDATGTLPAGGGDPSVSGLENALLHAINSTGSDIKGASVQGEIPITIPATPAISYAATTTLNGDFWMIVRGYRDIFAPR